MVQDHKKEKHCFISCIVLNDERIFSSLLIEVEILYDIPFKPYTYFMFRRPILCTLYGAVDFLMALASLVPFQGPKKSRFSGPTPSNAPRNDVAPLKTIMYRAI
jgi:hypothetical protein